MEFIGNRSGYHYIEKKSRIPGAIFGNCGSDAYHMEIIAILITPCGGYQEITSAWKEGGITPDKHVAFYSGTGSRGSEAFMSAWLMGFRSMMKGGLNGVIIQKIPLKPESRKKQFWSKAVNKD